jgi:hypothetical protein
MIAASTKYPDAKVWDTKIGMTRDFEFNEVTT